MTQSDEQDLMIPVQSTELKEEQRKEALAYVMFLKQKDCGHEKARRCADRWKQQLKVPHHELTFPTILTDAVFLTGLINAKEGWVVKTVNVLSVFM